LHTISLFYGLLRLCKKAHFSANQPAKRGIYHQDKEPHFAPRPGSSGKRIPINKE
jgi:hypothetical protein